MTFLFCEAMVPVNGVGEGGGGFSCALKTTQASPVVGTVNYLAYYELPNRSFNYPLLILTFSSPIIIPHASTKRVIQWKVGSVA